MENTTQRTGWLQSLLVYHDKRMAKILLLGFMSGLPRLFIGAMAILWLKEEGLSRTGIGLFGLILLVYAVNVFWAPVVDSVRLPWLTKTFGRRRAWIVLMQAVIVCVLVAIATLPQAEGNLWTLAALLFVIASASATQDVAIDALRIELINRDEPEKVGAGSAMATSGWILGFAGAKLLALPLVDYLEKIGVVRAWQVGYLAMTVVVVVSTAMLLFFVRETQQDNPKQSQQSPMPQHLVAVFVWRGVLLYWEPLRSFFSRYGARTALMLLFFIFFFKIGEAFLGQMSVVFYKEIGFSRSDIALYSGGYGTIAFCAFAVLGSIINARYGLFRGIVVGGIAMAATNLLFAALYYHPEHWLFTVAVVADQFTTAVSTVAFVAFLSQLCDRAHTATQYAAFASLGNLSRTTLAASSGALVDGLGGNWSVFFILTVLMVTPSLIILALAREKLRPIMSGATTKVL